MDIKQQTFNLTGAHAGNSRFAIGGVSFSADSFVVTESTVFRMNICGEKPAHCKSVNATCNHVNRLLNILTRNYTIYKVKY